MVAVEPLVGSSNRVPVVRSEELPSWTFLTNHAYVLACIARNPQVRLLEIAAEVGITERAVQRIVTELVADGVISRERVGRRNRYRLLHVPARHRLDVPLGVDDAVADLVEGPVTVA